MSDRPTLPALTSLRFFAALYVVLFHGASTLVHSQLGRSFVGTGFVAVNLFFVLSGFVLAYTYSDKEGQLRGTQRAFWSARFARVYPVYAASLLLGTPLYWQTLHAGASLPSALVKAVVAGGASLLLLQAWWYRIATAWNTPAWSLSVEAFLYLVFPLALPRITRMMRQWSIWYVAGAMWVVAMLVPLAYQLTNKGATDLRAEGAALDTIRFIPVIHVPSFLIGVVAGRAYLEGKRAPSWLAGVAIVLVSAALCAGAWLPYPMLHSGLLSPLFALLVFALADSQSVVARVLSARVLVVLGDASYALYLLHFLGLEYARRLLGHPLTVAELIGTIVVVQLVCLLVYRYFESPMRGKLRRALSA